MLKIELLNTNHKREKFNCGVPALNTFLQKTARQHIKKGISRTFVLIDDSEPDEILGFFTLTACEVRSSQLPQKYARKYPPIVPCSKDRSSRSRQGATTSGFGDIYDGRRN